MEQVEGGDLIVNSGNESRPKEDAAEKRDINAVEGLEAALKLAQVHVSRLYGQIHHSDSLAKRPS